MLTFKETEDHFVVIETTMSFDETRVREIKYSKDLNSVQIGDDPARCTHPEQVEWFEKHYRKHFE